MSEEATETITVNGVVFEERSTCELGDNGTAVLFQNGEMVIIRRTVRPGDERFTASCGDVGTRAELHSAEAAIRAFARIAHPWATVLRELARINGGAV